MQSLPLESLERRRLLAAVAPTSIEQYMVELINRARTDPAAEATRLSIDLNEGLAAGTISTAAKQPLAINLFLNDAARDHVDYLRDEGLFQHEGRGSSDPLDRMEAAGYEFTGSWGYAENLAVQFGSNLGSSPLQQASVVSTLHRGLFRDTEIPGRGHRTNMMNGSMREVGSGLSFGAYSYQGGQQLTGQLVGQDFAYSGTSKFLTGVAFNDSVVNDDFYTVGEGLGSISVVAQRSSDGASFSTTTWTSGGYTLALAAGTYTVTATGAGLGGAVVQNNVVISGQNVKVDFTPDEAQPFATLSAGKLTVQGTSGSDIIRLTASGANLSASLNGSTMPFTASAVLSIEIYAGDGNDLVDASAAVVPTYALGGPGRDNITTGSASDTLTGGGGHDTLSAGAGDDRLGGLAGNDAMNGDEGNDRLYGDDGNDRLIGGGGVDRIWAGFGDDSLDGGSSNDKLYGEAGADTLRGGRQNDRLDGGGGADQIFGDDGTDTALSDVLDTRTSVEVLE